MPVSIFYLILGVLVAGFLVRITLRRQILEKDSIIWLLGCIVILILSVFPNILGHVAAWVGIKYPPALLFLLAILFLMFMLLRLSAGDSEKQVKINELSQRIAILEEKLSHDKDDKDE